MDTRPFVTATSEAGGKVCFGHEFLSLDRNESGVSATVLERATGETYEVRSRYLIGADGERSRVAEQIDLPLMGQTGLGASVNCWFEADLSQYASHRPGVLYWMVTPGNDYWVGSGTFICVRPWNEWVMLFMYDPAQGEPDLSEKALLERIRRLVGDADVPVNIKSVGRWQINHVVAQRYSAGRVFCVGDAVHRHPPANGLGSNTSIQDSYNLAWKLALALEGKASASLLQTYNAERQPVGQQVADRAMKSVVDILPISNALGFRPGQSEDEGWRSLERLQEDSEQGRLQHEALREAIKLQNHQFNAHGVELGQRYRSQAVIPDGTPEPPYARDPELYYHPTTWPGARLPHAWLERSGERLSTLDIAGTGRFALFTGTGGDAWVEAAKEVQKKYGVCVEAHLVGGDLRDIYGDWAALRGVEEDGYVLVRPDLHVAWRSRQMADFPTERLLGVIGAVLGT